MDDFTWVFYGNSKMPGPGPVSGSLSDWILATGFWRDLGFWRDIAVWID